MSFRPHNKRTLGGFSLVELLVAMAIGLVLLTLLAVIFANASRSQKEITLAAAQIENGRYAMDILSDDVHHAGYWGYYPGATTLPGALPDPCSVNPAVLKTAMSIVVQGYNAPIATLPSCLASANYLAGTDILVVRRASTAITAPAGSLQSGVVYVQASTSPTDPLNPVVATNAGVNLPGTPGPFTACTGTPPTVSCTGTLTVRAGTGIGTLVAAPIRAYLVHTYFISPCSVPTGAGTPAVCTPSDDGGAPIPTLNRLTVDSAGAVTITPLAEGIENLQVDYGVDTDADGSPDGAAYVAVPGTGTVADWQKVMALRLYVLSRNTQKSSDYTDNKTYALGTAGNITISGSAQAYRRHVYTAVVRVKNQSERLETP